MKEFSSPELVNTEIDRKSLPDSLSDISVGRVQFKKNNSGTGEKRKSLFDIPEVVERTKELFPGIDLSGLSPKKMAEKVLDLLSSRAENTRSNDQKK